MSAIMADTGNESSSTPAAAVGWVAQAQAVCNNAVHSGD